MERAFDHSQKILLAVEFGTAPWMLPGYTVFQRLGIPEVPLVRYAAAEATLITWQ